MKSNRLGLYAASTSVSLILISSLSAAASIAPRYESGVELAPKSSDFVLSSDDAVHFSNLLERIAERLSQDFVPGERRTSDYYGSDLSVGIATQVISELISRLFDDRVLSGEVCLFSRQLADDTWEWGLVFRSPLDEEALRSTLLSDEFAPLLLLLRPAHGVHVSITREMQVPDALKEELAQRVRFCNGWGILTSSDSVLKDLTQAIRGKKPSARITDSVVFKTGRHHVGLPSEGDICFYMSSRLVKQLAGSGVLAKLRGDGIGGFSFGSGGSLTEQLSSDVLGLGGRISLVDEGQGEEGQGELDIKAFLSIAAPRRGLLGAIGRIGDFDISSSVQGCRSLSGFLYTGVDQSFASNEFEAISIGESEASGADSQRASGGFSGSPLLPFAKGVFFAIEPSANRRHFGIPYRWSGIRLASPSMPADVLDNYAKLKINNLSGGEHLRPEMIDVENGRIWRSTEESVREFFLEFVHPELERSFEEAPESIKSFYVRNMGRPPTDSEMSKELEKWAASQREQIAAMEDTMLTSFGERKGWVYFDGVPCRQSSTEEFQQIERQLESLRESFRQASRRRGENHKICAVGGGWGVRARSETTQDDDGVLAIGTLRVLDRFFQTMRFDLAATMFMLKNSAVQVEFIAELKDKGIIVDATITWD